MAVVTLNPILKSIHGKMGAIVFVYRNGTQFIRRYVVPRDPKTESQLKCRRNFGDLVVFWQKLPQGFKDSWNRYGETIERKGYNLFISENMKALRFGKPLELVKVKFLRKNEDSMLMAIKRSLKELQFSQSLPDAGMVFLYCEPQVYSRNFFYLQRE